MMEIIPRDQEFLFGHEDVLKRLKQAYDTGRLHHTLIFAGSEGIGKETASYHFMRYAFTYPNGNPRQGDLSVPEDNRAAKQITAGSHPQLFVIEPVYDDKKERYARDITLDALTDLSNFLRLAPTDDAPRFILINPAESLNRNAQNALLKVLEEPPQRTFFILITTQIGALLPTIRSRCMTIQFDGLDKDSFKQAAKNLAPEMDKKKIDAYFDLTKGAIGQAIRYEEFEVLDSYGSLCKAINEWAVGDTTIGMKLAERLAPQSEEETASNLIELIANRLARFLKESLAGQETKPLMPEEERLLALWSENNPETLIERHDRILSSWREAAFSYLDKKLVFLNIIAVLSGSDGKKSAMMQ